MKRKIKVWNKIRLYETSVVGIPAYPDAHASVESFSLIKALSNASLKGFAKESEKINEAQLNTGEVKNTMEETENKEESKVSEEVEAPEAEAVAEEAPAEAPAEESSEEKSADMAATIAKAIKAGIKDGIKELETERGLVGKQVIAEKSLGEMAMDKGLFSRAR